MAGLKEETTVDKTQSNEAEETVVERRIIDPSLDGIQLFYEKNKTAVNYAGGGLLLIIAAFCYFKLFYMPEREKEAANEIFWAQDYFEKDSFNLALKGGVMVVAPDGQKQMMGFEQIADEYSMTKSGDLANYCAGICYMRTGKFENAIEFLGKYDGDDEMVSTIAVGAIGDCNMELNRVEDAVKYYLKAADRKTNNFTTPLYLKKAGFAYENKGDFANALEAYERIDKEFSGTSEAQEIKKDIARVKALGNI
jgi:tetratricopeptide (TPR) repeat protein